MDKANEYTPEEIAEMIRRGGELSKSFICDESDVKIPVYEKTYRMAAEDRIESLSRSITRAAMGRDIDTQSVKEWAYEIQCQCELPRWMGEFRGREDG